MIIYGVTFDYTPNYGSSLQSYALSAAIESLEIHGEKCEYFIIPVNRMKFMQQLKKGNMKSLLLQPLISLHRIKFAGFEKKYMKYAPISQLDNLPQLNESADAFVCGSDVIWNPAFNCGMGAFYLDFARKYKFSYSASFGTAKIGKDQYDRIREYLSSFDAISVREKTSAAIARECTDKPVTVVCDPVFLLSCEDWETVIKRKKAREDYIFVYDTHINDEIKAFIKQLQKQTGLKVVLSTCGPKQAVRQGKLQIHSQEEWLRLLTDARYVVTNSFHATAFSIIFHKEFFTVVHGEINGGINMRMNDLLQTLNLQDRIYNQVPAEIHLSGIDYNTVQNKVNKMRQDSIGYLRNNLEAAYQRKIEEEANMPSQ